MATLARMFRWQVLSRTRSQVVWPWVEGLRLRARHGQTGMSGNVYLGLHEFEHMAFLLHMLRPDDTFCDIGANAGSYTLLAAGVVGAQVIAAEPGRSARAALEENLALNRLQHRCRVFGGAVGPAEGSVAFDDRGDTTAHVVDEHEGSFRVPMTSLDALCAGQTPTLVKVDVEGYEMSVLGGAGELLAAPVPAWIVETNGSGRAFEHSDAEVDAKMRAGGYTRWRYRPFERRLEEDARKIGTYSGNSLYLAEPAQMARLVAEGRQVDVYGVRL